MKCHGLLAGHSCTIPRTIDLRHPGLGDAAGDPVARLLGAAIRASRPVTGYFAPIAILLDDTCLMCIGRAVDGRSVLMASPEFVLGVYHNFGRDAVWGAVFHEVNHARAGHLLAPATGIGAAWPRETSCDIFAEQVLLRLGLDPEPFSELLESFGDEGGETHPAGSVRARMTRDARRIVLARR